MENKESILLAGGRVHPAADGYEMAVFTYPTLEAFIAATDACPEHRQRNEGRADWKGAKSYQDAVKIARHGLNVNHEAVHLQTFETFHNQTTEIVEDVVGGSVNIGAYLEGIPENMFDFRMVDNVKFIDVALVVTEFAGIESNQLNNKAMGTAWLVDSLENNGYRVRLSAIFATHGLERHVDELVKITIKDYQEPLAIGQISGACSASFFRWIEFRHMERFFALVPSRGVPFKLDRLQGVYSHLFNPGDEAILLPNLTMFDKFDLQTPESALDWAAHFSNHKITIQ